MDDVTFRQPEALWLLLVAALALLIWPWIRRVPFAAVSSLSLLAGRTFHVSWIRRTPFALGVFGLGAILVALADPILPYAEQRVESRGLDIAIVLDLSSSMEEVMGGAPSSAQRNRLDVTKRAILDFIAMRPGDRIGLIVFSDFAYVVSPLTVDHAYLRRYVGMIDTQILRSEGMTAIGEGVTVANALLSRQQVAESRRDRVIVIFTDGENNYGRDPFEALEDSRKAGYRVHLIGVDLEEEVKTKPDVLRLIRTVERRGGRYFTADTPGQLSSAARAIDALETGVLTTSRTVRNQPAFEWFAVIAIAFLSGGLIVRAVPFFIDRT